ncbi:hypothetical protein F5882DRAFT_380473 [Hyaloscypha sp. PMI_1271]|nr:hypothetical protein F5882DRAFT_380473 [Hyaloscypha sp. PMI_1271]
MSQQGGSSLTGAATVLPLSPLDIEVRGMRVGEKRPFVITLAYGNSQFVVELLPEPSTTTPTLLRYGFDPRAFASKYPAGPGPLPGYNIPNSIELADIVPDRGFDFWYRQPIISRPCRSKSPKWSHDHAERSTQPDTILASDDNGDGNASLIHRQEFTPRALSFEHQDMSGIHGDLPVFDVSQVGILETIAPERAYKVLADNRMQFSPLPNLSDLRDNMDGVSKLQQEDWASQAKNIIGQLHGIKVVWGNLLRALRFSPRISLLYYNVYFARSFVVPSTPVSYSPDIPATFENLHQKRIIPAIKCIFTHCLNPVVGGSS